MNKVARLPGGGSAEPIEGKCGSLLSSQVGYCTKDPVEGRTRCFKHGGHTPVGALSPHFKHGRDSRYVPQRIAKRFEAAKGDPELLSVHSSAAIIQARVDELLERVYSGESGANWRELFKLWELFTKHKRAGNVPGMQEVLELIDRPIRLGFADHTAWEELGLQVDRHARLADQEQKRRDKIAASMSVEEAMAMLGTVLDVITRHTSEEQQQAIGAELEQLVDLDAVPIAARSRRRR